MVPQSRGNHLENEHFEDEASEFKMQKQCMIRDRLTLPRFPATPTGSCKSDVQRFFHSL